MGDMIVGYRLFSPDLSSTGGLYRIQGTAARRGIPGVHRVFLFAQNSRFNIRIIWSQEDGHFSFDFIKYAYQGYFAVVFDRDSDPFSPAIEDRLTPELMP